MLPPEIKKLAEEAINNQIPKYHTATREAIQRVIYEFSNRGTLKSSAFVRADCECRIKTFTELGENIANAISQLHFDPPPNCENELVSLAKSAMTWTLAQENDNFRIGQSKNQEIHVIALSERCQRVEQETETKIKIHVQSLRHRNQQRISNANIIVGDGNNLQAGNANTIENNAPPSEKTFWEKGTFWGTIALIVLTAILVYFAFQSFAHAK